MSQKVSKQKAWNAQDQTIQKKARKDKTGQDNSSTASKVSLCDALWAAKVILSAILGFGRESKLVRSGIPSLRKSVARCPGSTFLTKLCQQALCSQKATEKTQNISKNQQKDCQTIEKQRHTMTRRENATQQNKRKAAMVWRTLLVDSPGRAAVKVCLQLWRACCCWGPAGGETEQNPAWEYTIIMLNSNSG